MHGASYSDSPWRTATVWETELSGESHHAGEASMTRSQCGIYWTMLPRCSWSTIKGTVLHPEQLQRQSNVSDYLGQSRMQSQRKRTAASFPREGNTWGFFQPKIHQLAAAEGFPKTYCISTLTHQFGSVAARNSLVYLWAATAGTRGICVACAIMS